jgi:hypothetical protein
VWARATTGGATGSFNLLKEASDKAFVLFKNNFKILDGPRVPDMKIVELDRELILTIDKENTERLLKAAQQNAKFAQEEYEKNKKLYETKSVDVKVAEESSFYHLYSIVKLKLIEIDYNSKIIKAPFDGIISSIYVKPHDQVEKEQLLFALVDPTYGYSLEIYLPSRYFKYVQLNNKILIDKEEANMVTISSVIEENKFKIIASVKGENLLDNDYINTIIHITPYKGKVVPKEAIFKEGADNFIFIMRDKIAYKIKVEIGEILEDKIEIISPEVIEEDLIIIDNLDKLNDGDLVNPSSNILEFFKKK